MLARIAFLIAFLFTPTSYADNHENALTGLQGATEELISSVDENRERMTNDRGFLYQVVREISADHFDFRRMSALALGKVWRSITDDEKSQFEKEFSALIIRTYATAILEYTNQDIVWGIGEPDTRGRVTVTAIIKDANGTSINVKFKLAKSNRYDGYRVYDVIIEGVSIIIGYRSTFAEKNRHIGINGIIDELHVKNNGASK